MQTESEENYLKAIYFLALEKDRAITTNELAEALGSKPSSITDMLKKLSGKELVDYTPYKGVKLNLSGRRAALMTIRKHRLWETFLVDTLSFSWDEVHEAAEQLEHVRSPLLMNRLDEFLGFPTRDPHGDPIPDKRGDLRTRNDQLLTQVNKGETYKVVRVKDSSNSFLQHLDTIKIRLETAITVLDRYEYDSSMLVKVNGNKEMVLSEKSCENIYVNPIVTP